MTYTPAELGKISKIPQSPDEAKLDPIPWVWTSPGDWEPPPVFRFSCPEFTSICPATGQPDFGVITIDYAPDAAIVESKSLKLFMGSFRNHPAFHEATTMLIAQRFIQCCAPLWLRISGIWYPRGGIPIDIFWQTGSEPVGAFVPPTNFMPFRGR